jgi:hypothetical protein
VKPQDRAPPLAIIVFYLVRYWKALVVKPLHVTVAKQAN